MSAPTPPVPPGSSTEERRKQALVIAQNTLALIELQLSFLEQAARNLQQLLDSLKAEP